MKIFKRSPQARLKFIMAILVLSVVGSVTRSDSQVLELRRTYERFETGKVQVGGELIGPSKSILSPILQYNLPYDAGLNPNGYLSVDLWQFRGGLRINSFANGLSPFLFFNPIIGNDFGGDSSRWSGSLGWEGIFEDDLDFDPKKNLQADNSVYSPKNSVSLMLGFWAGPRMDSTDRINILRRAYPTLPADSLRLLVNSRLNIDTNYWGRGYVDTNNFNKPPFDTAKYVRGIPAPGPLTGIPVYYTSRNGFSVALGLGNGKYAGSGKWSRHLNFLYDSVDINDQLLAQQATNGPYHPLSSFDGLNPMAVVRYRLNDFILHFDWAGEDGNVGLIYRGLRDFDVEMGAKSVEHTITPQAGDGVNKTQFFVGVRYAPPFENGFTRFEVGDEIYFPEVDTDGDGIIDKLEINLTHTDPNNPDSDGDGLSDGEEVLTYKSNPVNKDSDGDGLSDGEEVRKDHTDLLRPDTDGDGLTDGEEVTCDLDKLRPGAGARER